MRAALVALLVAQLVESAHASANVTLTAVVLHRQLSWAFSPQLFFRCSDGNQTELPFVQSLHEAYNRTGREGWQPILQLSRGECKSCGLYERGWFSSSPHILFPVCESNFSAPHTQSVHHTRGYRGGKETAAEAAGAAETGGRLALMAPDGSVELVLTCLTCAADMAAFAKFQAHTPSDKSPSLGVIFWIFFAVAIVGVTISLITLGVYLTKGSDTMVDDMERTKFIEMGEGGSSSVQGGLETQGSVDSINALEHERHRNRQVSDILKHDADEFV